MILTLRTVMQILDFRKKHLERKLGWSVSYLGRLLSGGIALRFEHILDISRAMGLEPQELLRFAYPEWGEPPSEAGWKVREIMASLSGRSAQAPPARVPPPPPPPSPAPSLTEADVERIISKTLRRVISDGVGAKG